MLGAFLDGSSRVRLVSEAYRGVELGHPKEHPYLLVEAEPELLALVCLEMAMGTLAAGPSSLHAYFYPELSPGATPARVAEVVMAVLDGLVETGFAREMCLACV